MKRLNDLEPILAKEIKKDIESLLDREFANKLDPNGKPWPQTKGTKKNPSHDFDPRDTIRSSIRVSASGNEIEITSTKPYTIYHQDGTKHLPQRMIYDENKLPKRWANQIDDTIERTLEKNIDMILGEAAK